jgi:hypothetical protein
MKTRLLLIALSAFIGLFPAAQPPPPLDVTHPPDPATFGTDTPSQDDPAISSGWSWGVSPLAQGAPGSAFLASFGADPLPPRGPLHPTADDPGLASGGSVGPQAVGTLRPHVDDPGITSGGGFVPDLSALPPGAKIVRLTPPLTVPMPLAPPPRYGALRLGGPWMRGGR